MRCLPSIEGNVLLWIRMGVLFFDTCGLAGRRGAGDRLGIQGDCIIWLGTRRCDLIHGIIRRWVDRRGIVGD